MTLAALGIAALCLTLAAVVAYPPGRATADEPKTLKERLSDKASDDQRVDNCHVPVARRGTTARPDCPAEAGSPASAATQDNKIPREAR
jgi:hypothetical protein